MSLYSETLAFEASRYQAAVAAIESRRADIEALGRMRIALRARGWAAEAVVTTEGPQRERCALALWMSVTERELADVIEHLGHLGVAATRIVHHDRRTLRHYTLQLNGFPVALFAQLHGSKEAA